MKRSFLLARVSVFSGQCSARNCAVFPAYLTRWRPLANPLLADSLQQAPRSLRCRRSAFTLIELLVVVAVIAVLAGITLAAMGGVNQKAARDRTKAEIAAIANALQAYQSQNGEYPPTVGGLVPYEAIQGYLATDRIEVSGTKLVDPFGGDYFYSRPGTRNRVSFDLWSTAGAATNESHKHLGNW